MKASVEEINTVQRRIKVELSHEDVDSAFQKVYQNLQKRANIKGFRKGKAPMNLIKKFYGGSVKADVADNLVRSHLFSAIEEQSLKPIAAPVLETAELPEEGKTYNFTALVDIMPSLTIDGYKGLELTYTPMQVDQGAVERELELLRKRQAKTKDLDPSTKVDKGHLAYITHKVYKGGEHMADLDATSVPVEVGQSQLHEELEKALIGMTPGEEKKVTIQLPADFQEADLAGQMLDFDLKLEKVQELVVPAADDEFAKDLGLESLDQLSKNLREQMERQAEQSRRQQLESSLLDQLRERNKFEVPPSMVDQVIDSMVDEMRFQNDQERAEAKNNRELRGQLLETAKQKAQNTLILHEIIKKEELKVTDDDVDAYAREVLGQMRGASEEMDPKLLESVKRSLGPHAKENLLFNKALDYVIEQGNVKENAPA